MKTGRQNSPMPQSLGNLIPSKPLAIYTGNIFIQCMSSQLRDKHMKGGVEKLYLERSANHLKGSVC